MQKDHSMNKSKMTSWELPDFETLRADGFGPSNGAFDDWVKLVTAVSEIGQNNSWSKRGLSQSAGVADGTFSQWLSGKYQGSYENVNRDIRRWLDAYGEQARMAAELPKSPSYFDTSMSRQMLDCLRAAQIMPGIVTISCEAGLGKTMTAEHHKALTPNTFMATISPHTKTVHGCLVEIAETIGVSSRNNGTLVRSIGERIRGTNEVNTLLIIDEAQNLIDDAINQLRHFTDQYKCGIALVGNSETYTRYSNEWSSGPKFGQLRRRIFKRMKIDKPPLEDVDLFLSAWGVSDEQSRKFLTGVAMKPGALGQVDQTIKLAKIMATGEQREATYEDFKAAWQNRGVEAL